MREIHAMPDIEIPDPSHSLHTVIINGSLSRPSKTRTLLDAIQRQLSAQLSLQTQTIDVVDLIDDIGTCLWREQLPPAALSALHAIEQADLLIVGTPVYRGSMPGLFKHLFDLVDTPALAGKPVLLAATGGSTRHALVIDHQLRPLFNFFQTLTLPIGIFGTPEDFSDGEISSSALQARIALAVQMAAPVLYNFKNLQTNIRKNELLAA